MNKDLDFYRKKIIIELKKAIGDIDTITLSKKTLKLNTMVFETSKNLKHILEEYEDELGRPGLIAGLKLDFKKYVENNNLGWKEVFISKILDSKIEYYIEYVGGKKKSYDRTTVCSFDKHYEIKNTNMILFALKGTNKAKYMSLSDFFLEGKKQEKLEYKSWLDSCRRENAKRMECLTISIRDTRKKSSLPHIFLILNKEDILLWEEKINEAMQEGYTEMVINYLIKEPYKKRKTYCYKIKRPKVDKWKKQLYAEIKNINLTKN